MDEAPGKTSSHQEGNDFTYIRRGGRLTQFIRRLKQFFSVRNYFKLFFLFDLSV